MRNLNTNQTQTQAPLPPPYQPQHYQRPPRQPPPPAFYEEEIPISSDSSDNKETRRRRKPIDDDLGLKIDIPDSEGSLTLDDFVDCLHTIERVLEYKKYLDEKKCKVAIWKFKYYTSLWW